MNKANELKTTKAIVRGVLTDIPQTRDSDSLLYLKVLQKIARVNDIRLERISVPAFLIELEQSKFPCFESVRRTRQKLQAEFPELSANAQVKSFREQNEEIFREFARE